MILSKTDVKRTNLIRVLTFVMKQEETTNPEIARGLGLSMPTVCSLVDDWVARRFLRYSGTGTSTEWGGKKPRLITMNPDGVHIMSLHLSVEKVDVALVNLQGSIKGRVSRTIQPEEGQAVLAEIVTNLVNDLFARAQEEHFAIIGIGVTVSGIIDPTTGISKLAANFKQMNGLPIHELLSCYALPVWVDNECRGVALAEKWFGSAREAGHFISLYTDIGIGAGFVIDHEVVRGTDYSFGEVGHMTIQMDGPLCTCGNQGCWEVFASSKALIQAVGERIGETIWLKQRLSAGDGLTVELIAEAIRAGDRVVKEIAIDRLGLYLGVGLTNLVNAFNPEYIFLYGEIRWLGEELLIQIREQINARGLSVPTSRVKIGFSKFGDEGPLIGATALAFEQAMKQPELFM